MLKKSLSIIRDSRVIELPFDFKKSGIEEFDKLIYNAYIVKTSSSVIKKIGIRLEDGIERLENTILVLSNKYTTVAANNRWLLKEYLSSDFLVYLDNKNNEHTYSKGYNCYCFGHISSLSRNDFPDITYVGKCVVEKDIDWLNDEYKIASELYPKGLFEKIRYFVELEKE